MPGFGRTIQEKKGQPLVASRGGRGAVVPRPFAIGRYHSGGVASPLVPILARVPKSTTAPTTTGDDGGTGSDNERTMHSFHVGIICGESSNAPLVNGPKFPLTLATANPSSSHGEDWRTIDADTVTTRRIWGLEEAMRASEAGGYDRLAPICWDATLHLDLEPTQILVAREEASEATSATSRIRTVGVNVKPFYVVAAQYHATFGETHPFIEGLSSGTINWDGVDIDDLRRVRGVHIWKVYPKERATKHTFQITCYDNLKNYGVVFDDWVERSVDYDKITSYREMASTLAGWDAMDPLVLSASNQPQSVVWWHIIAEKAYDYSGVGTGTYATAPYDLLEIHGTAKLVVQQKWAFYERSDQDASDTTAT